jgi:hypothetical protein
MPVQAMNQGMNARFDQMSSVTRGLSRLLPRHSLLWVDEAEGVNHHLALDGLDRIYDNCNGTFVRLLK